MITIKYEDFLDMNYAPAKDDLIVLFRITPAKGFSMEKAAARVASESSNGTWAGLRVPEHITKLSAHCYDIDKDFVKVAYPFELFEEGNMPQILSSIAGNIFGMKAIDGLRIEDIHWPKKLIKSFKGPQFGINGVRDFMKVDKRPLTATVPKPKVGYYSEEHADVGYKAWTGGIDFLKDDENLTSQNFNKFKKRLDLSMKMREKAEKETGETKSYFVNITAETEEMKRRAELVKEYDNEYVMVDILTVGWGGVQTIRDKCEELGLAIHAHRAFHAAFDRNPKHGMSMKVIAEIARIIGVDNLHIGGLGKLVGDKKEVSDNHTKTSLMSNTEGKLLLEQEWYGTKPVFGTCSGGLHPGIIKRLIDLLGSNILIQAGGGVHGHPDGTHNGAKALRQSITAIMKDISVEEYAEKHKELKKALDKWGSTTPK